MTKTTKLNVKLLRRIEKHILEEPKRFIMDDVFETGEPGDWIDHDGIISKLPDCGTAACIAGWACLLSREKIIDMDRAAELLGLPDIMDTLFLVSYWPVPFRDRWYAAETRRGKAKVAVARIEHLIKKGE